MFERSLSEILANDGGSTLSIYTIRPIPNLTLFSLGSEVLGRSRGSRSVVFGACAGDRGSEEDACARDCGRPRNRGARLGHVLPALEGQPACRAAPGPPRPCDDFRRDIR